MVPTMGRVVIYKFSDDDKEFLKEQDKSNINDEAPAMIVKTWGTDEKDSINLKVMVDGHDDMWKTSIYIGDIPGTWHWPVKV